MIASVTGTVSGLLPDGVVVEVGGVGLAVQTTPGTRLRLRVGDDARLATTLVVREDSLTLYGFADDDERALFELLQTSSGVGPRLAQAVLAHHTPDTVRRALLTEDLAVLVQVPGIGRKGAQRMVLELKDKVGRSPGSRAARHALPSWRDTLAQALIGLGWTQAQADDVVARLADEHPDATDADVPALLRAGPRPAGPRVTDGAEAPRRGPCDLPVPAAEARRRRRARRGGAAPPQLDDFVGQERVREQLSLRARERQAPGPPARPRPAVRRARASARPRWP